MNIKILEWFDRMQVQVSLQLNAHLKNELLIFMLNAELDKDFLLSYYKSKQLIKGNLWNNSAEFSDKSTDLID